MLRRSKNMIVPTYVILSQQCWLNLWEALPMESRLCLANDGEDRESLLLYDHTHRPVVFYYEAGDAHNPTS